MRNEFLDYVEDIADAMEKAEILLRGVAYDQFESDFRINLYDTVDLEIVWDVVKQDIPQIKPQIQQILRDYEA
jgi:uncharacterized protein with HEPN domain